MGWLIDSKKDRVVMQRPIIKLINGGGWGGDDVQAFSMVVKAGRQRRTFLSTGSWWKVRSRRRCQRILLSIRAGWGGDGEKCYRGLVSWGFLVEMFR